MREMLKKKKKNKKNDDDETGSVVYIDTENAFTAKR